MGLNGVLSKLTIVKYAHKIKATPREIISNRRLLLSAALYACAGIPISELSPALRSILGFIFLLLPF